MRAIELFAGIGGFRLGLERNNISVIWANEWDKYAADTYDKNFKDNINRQDITAVDVRSIPGHDLLVGGFPCQAFSIAGKRHGFKETRGTLFFDVARILEHHRPRHLVLENVKGLLTHDAGKTFQVILGVLADLGYRVEWQVLNSKDFGVPQNRERVYIVGHLRDGCAGQVLPVSGADRQAYRSGEHEPQGSQKFIKTRHLSQNGGLISDSTTVQASEVPHVIQLNQPKHSNDRVYSIEGISPTLNTMQGGNRQPFVTSDSVKIRRLTPVECERLQGFPDNWTVGSDTQRYKQCGNAVTVNVVDAVASSLAGHDA